MFKRINNWHLSVLVAVASIFSLVLVQQYVTAQGWVDPTEVPGGTPASSLVVNPLSKDLQLNGYDILGTDITIDSAGGTNVLQVKNNKSICLGGVCKNAWPDVGTGLWDNTNSPDIFYNNGNVGIGTGSVINANLVVQGQLGEDIMQINDSSGNDVVVFTADGYLGLGTNTPNKNLHILSATGYNAELDIQTPGGTHWGIYQSGANGPLKFWHGDDNVSFSTDGNITASGVVCDSNGCIGSGGGGTSSNFWVEDASDNLSRATSSVYFMSNTASALPSGASGAGTRLLWYPNKGAIRGGAVEGIQWADSKIGLGSIAFGKNNTASGDYSAILGGRGNLADGSGAIITGGGDIDGSDAADRNYGNGYAVFIGAGARNEATGDYSVVSGGYGNNSTAEFSAILGGQGNSVGGLGSVLVGGEYNSISLGVDHAFLGGGNQNYVKGNYSVIGGGLGNEINSTYSIVGGGASNISSSTYSVIIGGKENEVGGIYSNIGGGQLNKIYTGGDWSTISGGYNNIINSAYSFVGGKNMQLTSAADNTFVWGVDNSPVSISRENSFLVFPTNPPGINSPRVGIGTASPNSTLHIKTDPTATDNAEIDIQSGSSPYWGIYQDDTSDELRFWHASDNILKLSSEGVGVNSNATDGSNYYVQLDLVNSTPAAADCDDSSEYGRMIFGESGGTTRLWICYDTGWSYANFTN